MLRCICSEDTTIDSGTAQIIPFVCLPFNPPPNRFHVSNGYFHYIKRRILDSILTSIRRCCSIDTSFLTSPPDTKDPTVMPMSSYSTFRLLGLVGAGKSHLLAALAYSLMKSFFKNKGEGITCRPLYILGSRLQMNTLKGALLVSFSNEQDTWKEIYSINDLETARLFLQKHRNFILIVDDYEKIVDSPIFQYVRSASKISIEAVTMKYWGREEVSKDVERIVIPGSAPDVSSYIIYYECLQQ